MRSENGYKCSKCADKGKVVRNGKSKGVQTVDIDNLIVTLDGNYDHYVANTLSVTDYYAFGGIMPGRTYSSDDCRYGFNGMEKDDELKGSGNSYDFGARLYDPRIGRWLSVDPLENKYPSSSTYGYSINNPILFIDPDGKQVKLSGTKEDIDALITVINERLVGFQVKLGSGNKLEIVDDGEGFKSGSTYSEVIHNAVTSKEKNKFEILRDNSNIQFHGRGGKDLVIDVSDFENLGPDDKAFAASQVGLIIEYSQLDKQGDKSSFKGALDKERDIIKEEYDLQDFSDDRMREKIPLERRNSMSGDNKSQPGYTIFDFIGAIVFIKENIDGNGNKAVDGSSAYQLNEAKKFKKGHGWGKETESNKLNTK